MTIAQGSKVGIHYTLTNNDGDVLDSSQGREPLVYTAGAGEIIPGLDQALVGKVVGDHIEVSIAPEEAYGPRQEEAVQKVPKAQFEAIPDLQVGMPLQAQTPEGPVTVFVADIDDEHVTIDGNHPLAGLTLNFAVDVVTIDDGATEDDGPKIILPN